MKNIKKLFSTDLKSVDAEARTVEVVFSTEDVDRDGEIVVQSGWDFEDYAKNPVILWGHDSSEPPVGKALDLRTEGTKSIAKIQFAKDDSVAERLFNLVKQGILKTVSAGFINEEWEDNRLIKNRLMEISWVSIPANQNAITLAYDSGMISKDDTEFLVKSYQKQLDYLQKSHGKIKEHEGSMDEAKLAELLKTTLDEAIKPLNEKIEALEVQKTEEPETKPPVAVGSPEGNDAETYTAEQVESLVNEALDQAYAAMSEEDKQ